MPTHNMLFDDRFSFDKGVNSLREIALTTIFEEHTATEILEAARRYNLTDSFPLLRRPLPKSHQQDKPQSRLRLLAFAWKTIKDFIVPPAPVYDEIDTQRYGSLQDPLSRHLVLRFLYENEDPVRKQIVHQLKPLLPRASIQVKRAALVQLLELEWQAEPSFSGTLAIQARNLGEKRPPVTPAVAQAILPLVRILAQSVPMDHEAVVAQQVKSRIRFSVPRPPSPYMG